MPMKTDCAFGAEIRKYARPCGSTIGYWYPGALSGDGLASGPGCVVVAGATAGGDAAGDAGAGDAGGVDAEAAGASWPKAAAPPQMHRTNRAAAMRAKVMDVSPI